MLATKRCKGNIETQKKNFLPIEIFERKKNKSSSPLLNNIEWKKKKKTTTSSGVWDALGV
jgi:hypothetical protein